MRDSYQQLFDQPWFDQDRFFEFGISNLIAPSVELAEQEWQALKNRVRLGEEVFIRRFGAASSQRGHIFQRFYAYVIGHENVRVDPSNNMEPYLILERLTGYSKRSKRGYRAIQNYQVSHVFGRTKNLFAFTAPWNLCYIPKMFDPFTGHEAHGDIVSRFQKEFENKAWSDFGHLIDEFNELVSSPRIEDKKKEFLELLDMKKSCGQYDYSDRDIKQFRLALEREFAPITEPISP